jgi:maltooligosyltrehalose trehalohydrolase
LNIGTNYTRDGKCEFVVWAPLLKDVTLKLLSPVEQIIPLKKDKKGYWASEVDNVSAETLYLYRLENEKDRPDPASHFQPEGVHGPSQAVDHNSFNWEDDSWEGIPLSDMIIYELHVGTFTSDGTFGGVISQIPELIGLGINAIEIMPVAQFPGERNWGYDGTYPFAVQNSYGGPEGFKRLVNYCHKNGLAVILDVVYNHIGPEGNYLWDYGPYFTDKYKTPWGMAINFDDAFSNEVRNYFIENALHWFKNYHIDALRLDAIHGISDLSAIPFLQELAEKVENLSSVEGRKFYLIAESDLNDSRVIKPRKSGGYGIDAQWCDDFHHSVHTLLTGEKDGYYIDFGRIGHLVKSLREGFVYSGEYSEYRKRNQGNSSKYIPAEQFVVFSQNHDQIGNRMFGERLSNLVSFESLKLAAGIVLFSPYIPLLFMGEEYGEDVPFLYFVSHSDKELIEAVRKGRREEFKSFSWDNEPPDPQSADTFLKSKLSSLKKKNGNHNVLLNFYKFLINLRKKTPALSNLNKDDLDVSGFEDDKILVLKRWKDENHVFCIFNFNGSDINLVPVLPAGYWEKMTDSSDICWEGPGSLLPEKISGGEEITLRRHSFSIYNRVMVL